MPIDCSSRMLWEGGGGEVNDLSWGGGGSGKVNDSIFSGGVRSMT